MPDQEKAKAEPTEFVEHARAATKAMVYQWRSLIPDDFWRYGREAQRETLLALRALVDTSIERLEKVEQKAEAPKPRAPRKAKVEVE